MNDSGILLVNKAIGSSSFQLVRILRKITGIKKIGHAGTLDPLASGVMVMLLGKEYTKKSGQFLTQDKDYLAKIHLGIATDTYDQEGQVTKTNPKPISLPEIENALTYFQGEILQTPPMFSAKKVQGKKLYQLAKKGITIERKPCLVTVKTELLSFSYPFLELFITCSKGTYIRSIAHDLGEKLGCGAHLHSLVRQRVGSFHLTDCTPQENLQPNIPLKLLKVSP